MNNLNIEFEQDVGHQKAYLSLGIDLVRQKYTHNLKTSKKKFFYCVSIKSFIQLHIQIFPNRDINIVVIGSGNGVFEKIIQQYFPNVICIDPNPFYFVPEPLEQDLYMKPKYKYVSDLITDCPDLIGNCAVFIPWPYPIGYDHHPSTMYDIEAIRLLNPIFVSVITGRNSDSTMMNASSTLYHEWSRNNIKNDDKLKYIPSSVYENLLSMNLTIPYDKDLRTILQIFCRVNQSSSKECHMMYSPEKSHKLLCELYDLYNDMDYKCKDDLACILSMTKEEINSKL